MADFLRRLFSEGFRIFFLAAGLYAIFTLLVWEIYLGVHAAGGMISTMPFDVVPHHWHAHEMIFGYSSAALGGFLLTAVPNWTGTRAAPHYFIAFVAGLWLTGRVAIWFSGTLPLPLVAAVDLAFLPLMAFKIALQLIKRPKPQNLVFLGIILLLWISNLMVHLQWLGLTGNTLDVGLRAGIFTLCTMIAVLGGRVTPAFTRNAMKRAGQPEAAWPKPRKFIELPAVILVATLPVSLMVGAPDPLLAVIALVGGAMQFVRLAFWRTFWTIGQPILWALHLGIAMLGLGLILWGLSLFGVASEVAALHVLGIGCVGGMTLAVMSRAILGHTGRALIAPWAVVGSYALIALAAGVRWVGSVIAGDLYFPATLASGAIWILGFSLFVGAMWPALTEPRLPRTAK